ncbi:MAG: flagellar basal body-associated FliL family protein [Opitutaceae bacterium]
MAAKTESKEPPAEKPALEAPAGPKGPSGLAAWIPAAASVLLAPVACFAVVQFVLIPRFVKKLTAPVVAEAAPAETPAPAKAADGKAANGTNSYDFTNVVVNLSGTMGTRYLKTTFTVTGADAALKQQFDANKARLTDVTLNVLSSLSLADLEEAGSKNVIRDKLVTAYNQALGHRVVEQVYFSDFLIQ